MSELQNPEPIKPGQRADRIAREISKHHDTAAAFDRVFGPAGHREKLPLSLRNAVRARLEDKRPYKTEEEIHIGLGESTSLAGKYKGSQLKQNKQYFVDSGGTAGTVELCFVGSEAREGGRAYTFKDRKGEESVFSDTTTRLRFHDVDEVKSLALENASFRKLMRHLL